MLVGACLFQIACLFSLHQEREKGGLWAGGVAGDGERADTRSVVGSESDLGPTVSTQTGMCCVASSSVSTSLELLGWGI